MRLANRIKERVRLVGEVDDFIRHLNNSEHDQSKILNSLKTFKTELLTNGDLDDIRFRLAMKYGVAVGVSRLDYPHHCDML